MDDVSDFGNFVDAGEIEGAVEYGVTILVVGEWSELGSDGASDEGCVCSLAEVLLSSSGEYFEEGLPLNDGAPGGVGEVVGVVGDKDAVDLDVFFFFHPNTKSFEDGRLSFCTEKLLDGHHFCYLSGVG